MRPHRTRLFLVLALAGLLCAAHAGAAASPPAEQPATLPGWALRAELQAVSGSPVPPTLRDNQFVVVDHAWLRSAFLPFFRGYLVSLRAHRSGDGMDCDNDSDLFRSQLIVANILAGGSRHGEVPCATLVVRPEKPFARVPADPGGLHQLVAVRTERGWFVIEPQTTALCPLHAYPNIGTIESILL
ncbi:hypothetical protein MASR2M8_26090 [Opitutaceae bacterium]